jgi:hypothetical protein
MEKHAEDRKEQAIKKLAPPVRASLLCGPRSPLQLPVILFKHCLYFHIYIAVAILA